MNLSPETPSLRLFAASSAEDHQDAAVLHRRGLGSVRLGPAEPGCGRRAGGAADVAESLGKLGRGWWGLVGLGKMKK